MKKLLCILAALAMLTASAVSCTTPSDNDETHQGSPSTGGTAEVETDPILEDGLPDDLNFNGEEIVILRSNWKNTTIGVPPEIEQSVQEIDDAVYERDRKVGERLNVKLSAVELSSASTDVKAMIELNDLAALASYDIVTDRAADMFLTTLSVQFADLRNTPYVDLSRPWWMPVYNTVANFGGMQFSATGSMLLSPYRAAMVTIFNKDLFDSHNQPYLYESVTNGTWTLDQQAALVSLFHSDNGNGKQDLEGDIYGFVSADLFGSVNAYLSACRLDLVNTESMAFAPDAERFSDAVNKIIALYHNADGAAYIATTDETVPGRAAWDEAQSEITGLFGRKSAAMATLQVQALERTGFHRAEKYMGDWYGIVPMPKLDEAQESYYTYLEWNLEAIGILAKDAERLSRIGAVVEAMSSEGYNLVRPVYEKEIFRAENPAAKQMTRLITDGFRMDLADLISSRTSTEMLLRNSVKQGSRVTAAQLKTSLRIPQRSVNHALEQIADKVAALRTELGYSE